MITDVLEQPVEEVKKEERQKNSPKDFTLFYQTQLLPSLEVLDKQRKNIVNPIYFFILIPVLAASSIAVVTDWELLVVGIFMIIGGLIGGGLYYAFYHKRLKALKKTFKQDIIAKLVKFVDDSLYYSAEGSISEYDYRESKIFLQGVDRYAGDDLVSGTIGKTRIRFSEVHSEYKTESTDDKGRRKTQWHTIFHGIFFIADFNKHFKGETIVLPDLAERLFGAIGGMFQKMNMNRGKLIKLEDPDFEKNYVVYGDDQVEARYILSPALMQRMVELQKKTKSVCSFSFINSKVFIAISLRKNLFEPPFFGSMLKQKLVDEFHQYLTLSVGIVEELDLNTRIWTKE